jgi:hypothetical protein
MATRYVNTASSAGGDGTTNGTVGANRAYATLAEWEAARQGTLSEVEEVICEGSAADTTVVAIDGWTTTAANYILIRSAETSRHAGVWNSGVYRLEFALSSDGLVGFEDFCRIHALQVSVNTTTALAGIIFDTVATSGLFVTSCIVRATVAAPLVGIWKGSGNAGSAISVLANNLVYGFSGVGGFGIYARSNAAATRCCCYNNTVYGCATGFRFRDDFTLAKNNLSIGCTNAYNDADTPESGSTHNGYDEGPDPASNGINLSGSSDGDIFVNAGAGDFRLVSGSDAADVGTDLSGDGNYPFSDDIQGETRTGTWDIGADEFVVASAPLPHTHFYLRQGFQ